MAGYPSVDTSVQAVLALAKAGADIIELGLPFSDPIADGPINQHAAEVALSQGFNLTKLFEMVECIRRFGCQTPIILFSYLNPILAMGFSKFAQQAIQSGLNGIIIVDLPPEQGKETYQLLSEFGLELVFFASPTSDYKRFSIYQELKPSFIYYISRLAVTGLQQEVAANLQQEVAFLRIACPDFNIAVGFGIANEKQAQQIAKYADAVIIGSLLVKTLGEKGITEFQKLAERLVKSVH